MGLGASAFFIALKKAHLYNLMNFSKLALARLFARGSFIIKWYLTVQIKGGFFFLLAAPGVPFKEVKRV